MALTSAVVEFHGFKDNSNRFVVKELAVVSRYFQTQLIFDAPYSEKFLSAKMLRTARWVSRHLHFLKWDAPGVPYDEELIRALCSPFTVIYTKGSEKVKFLREFHPNVQDIQESYARPSGMQVPCILPQHNGYYSGKCALLSAQHFYNLKFGSPPVVSRKPVSCNLNFYHGGC